MEKNYFIFFVPLDFDTIWFRIQSDAGYIK